MNGKVTKLCDLTSICISPDLLTASVDMQQVEHELRKLSVHYADRIEVENVNSGDIVYCTADNESYPDGRSILLYTALNIPGAEDAVKKVLGKHMGDTMTVVLSGKEASLTVKKIIRLIPVEVNDKLIASMGIDGVFTVDDYRAYIKEKMLADIRMENHKMAIRDVMAQMTEKSSFEYDDAEADKYLAENMEAIKADYEAVGMEPPTVEELREGVLEQSKQGWLAEEFCRRNNIEIDKAGVEAEADQMLEMMSIMGEKLPEREKMIEEALRNAYAMALFEKIDAFLAELENTGR